MNKFQNANVSKKRQTGSNSDFLPRLFVGVTYDNDEEFRLLRTRIFFTDFHRIFQSSLVKMSFQLKMYHLSNANKEIKFNELIQLNQAIIIENLKEGVYLIQVKTLILNTIVSYSI